MATFARDDFTDVADTELSAHAPSGPGAAGGPWVQHGGSQRAAELSGAGRLRCLDGVGAVNLSAIYYASGGTPASAEYDVQATLVPVGTVVNNSAIGVCARLSESAATYYHARYNYSTGRWQLYEFISGSASLLGEWAESAPGTRVLKLEIRDASKKIYVDGTQRISSASNGITAAGRAGVRLFGPEADDTKGHHLDNFSASDPATAGTTVEIAASGGGEAVAGAHVRVVRSVVASGGGEAAGEATVRAVRFITATGGGDAQAAAVLRALRQLVATGGGQADAQALVRAVRRIVAAGGGEATATAALAGGVQLVVSGGGAALATVTVRVVRPIAASGGGTGDVSASARVLRRLSVAGGGLAAADAALRVVRHVVALGGGEGVAVVTFASPVVSAPIPWDRLTVSVQAPSRFGVTVAAPQRFGVTVAR